ncbi:MAG: hypothetical protein C3F15_06385 [Holophagae bacterium]|nr:MAG: hypothetical protein C3F15_06385 [Holophagae bacterium]
MEDPPIPRHHPPAGPIGADDGGTPAALVTAWLVPAIALAVGLVVSCWETLTSGFRLVQGDLGDTRLVNFTLEHSYRWLCGMPLAEDLWSPPIFHPLQHAAFYTDLLFGVAPLYWPWRWLGCEPETAYQLWMISVWSVNFVAAYLLLRRGLRASVVGAAVGAYLFAFASSMMVNIVHQQLVARFFLLAALAGAVATFRQPTRPRSRSEAWGACSLLWLGVVAQLYTAIYPLVVFVLAAASAAIWALLVPRLRTSALTALKHHAVPLIVTAMCAAALSAPAAIGYATAASEVGLRPAHRVSYPRALSWFLTGRTNRLYGDLQARLHLEFDRKPLQNNGLGCVTLAAAAWGLWLGRRRREVQLVLVSFAGLVFLTVVLPGGWSPWLLVRELLPPAAAMRAVARVGLMTLFPAALGLAIVFDRLAGARRGVTVVVLALAVAAEQSHRTKTYDKQANRVRIASLAWRVPTDAGSFLFFVEGARWHEHVHDEAAWVALATGVPTVNGRSGKAPRGWELDRPEFGTPEERHELLSRLERWARRTGFDSAAVAWVKIDPSYHQRR